MTQLAVIEEPMQKSAGFQFPPKMAEIIEEFAREITDDESGQEVLEQLVRNDYLALPNLLSCLRDEREKLLRKLNQERKGAWSPGYEEAVILFTIRKAKEMADLEAKILIVDEIDRWARHQINHA